MYQDLRLAVSERAAAFACLRGRDREDDDSPPRPRAAPVAALRGLPGAQRRRWPLEPAAAFVERWSAGDDAAAARLTDDPKAAAAALKANRRGLDGASVEATLGELKESGDAATARLTLRWQIPRIGGWATTRRSACARSEDEWRVRWSPKTVHPKLDGVTRLGTTSVPKARGEILDRDRRPLMRERRGGARGRRRGEGEAARRHGARAGRRARRRCRAAWSARSAAAGSSSSSTRSPCARTTTAACAPALDAVPDAATAESTAMLAPSRGFARALLGTVAPATKEQLEKLGGSAGPGADVGQWGLQARFERRLAPVPERRVVIRAGAMPIETLAKRRGRRAARSPPRSTRGCRPRPRRRWPAVTDEAALVAVQPSTGDVLAVANRPLESSYDRALEGTYAPGSTFKVVSTAALLRDGLSVGDTVRCPPTIEAGGRQFKNFEGGAAGAVPFSRDFAVSCNTAFVSLAPRLAPDALSRTARDYGLGRKLDLAVPAAGGQVPPGEDAVERAAAMIGQHEILASPLAMASVAATVADGPLARAAAARLRPARGRPARSPPRSATRCAA